MVDFARTTHGQAAAPGRAPERRAIQGEKLIEMQAHRNLRGLWGKKKRGKGGIE